MLRDVEAHDSVWITRRVEARVGRTTGIGSGGQANAFLNGADYVNG